MDRVYSFETVYGILWLFRRFGLLILVTVLIIDLAFLFQPVSVRSWYAGRSLIALSVPAALAAWALWVILSAKRRPATESAGY